MEEGSEVSYAQVIPRVIHSLLLLSVEQDVELSVLSPATRLPVHTVLLLAMMIIS